MYMHALTYICNAPGPNTFSHTITVKDIAMKTAVLLLVSALQLQLVVSNLTYNKTKLKDVMCDATSSCLDGEHCCYNTDGTPAGCCDDGFVCDVPAGTCDLKPKKGAVMKSKPMKMNSGKETLDHDLVGKIKDVMCDATSACLDGEHCCYNTDGTPAGCCDDGFVCDVAAGTCDLKGENGTVMKGNGESMRMKSTNATVKSTDPSPYCKKDHKFGVNPCSGTWTDYWFTHTHTAHAHTHMHIHTHAHTHPHGIHTHAHTRSKL
jgi:hypothetical protein